MQNQINNSNNSNSSNKISPNHCEQNLEKSKNKQILKTSYSLKKLTHSSAGTQIWEGISRHTLEPVIIKRCLKSKTLPIRRPLTKIYKTKDRVYFHYDEATILKKAHQACPEFTLPVLEKFECSKYLIFVQPKFGVSLYNFMIERKQSLNIEEATIIFTQVIQALSILQGNNNYYQSNSEIYHLDVKEENILIDPETLQIKLIDFGCSSIGPLSPEMSRMIGSKIGSREFCAPELYLGKSQESTIAKHDVWSLAMTIVSAMTGKTLYSQIQRDHPNFSFSSSSGKNSVDSLDSAGSKDQDLVNLSEQVYGPKFLVMLKKMLVYEPEKRISMGGLVDILRERI